MKSNWKIHSEGVKSFLKENKYGWNLQIYYPKFKLNKNEAYIKLSTGLRWARYDDKSGGWGFGFQIFGMGLGIAWQGHKCNDCNGLGIKIVVPNNSDFNRMCKFCDGDGIEKFDKCNNCGHRYGRHRQGDLNCPDKIDENNWNHDWLSTCFKAKKLT